MSLEHPVMPKSKKMLAQKNNGTSQKDTDGSLKGLLIFQSEMTGASK